MKPCITTVRSSPRPAIRRPYKGCWPSARCRLLEPERHGHQLPRRSSGSQSRCRGTRQTARPSAPGRRRAGQRPTRCPRHHPLGRNRSTNPRYGTTARNNQETFERSHAYCMSPMPKCSRISGGVWKREQRPRSSADDRDNMGRPRSTHLLLVGSLSRFIGFYEVLSVVFFQSFGEGPRPVTGIAFVHTACRDTSGTLAAATRGRRSACCASVTEG